MNEFKGTPGPWFHHGPSGSQHTMGGYINSSPERNSSNVVCSVYGTNGQPHEENAKLIAAAPELLEALAAASKKLEDVKSTFHGGFYTGRELYTDLFAKIDGALAKALGK
jgi:hypothetical protein